MSLARQFIREMRPLFRMLESPFGPGSRLVPSLTRSSGIPSTRIESLGMFDPFFPFAAATLPAVDVKEEPGAFLIEAELPGVKKENVDLRIGEDGQTVTIESRMVIGTSEQPVERETKAEAAPGEQQEVSPATLSSERMFTGESSFSRAIWLPRRVDSSGVSAKLQDGILTVRIPKAEQQAGVKVNIE